MCVGGGGGGGVLWECMIFTFVRRFYTISNEIVHLEFSFSFDMCYVNFENLNFLKLQAFSNSLQFRVIKVAYVRVCIKSILSQSSDLCNGQIKYYLKILFDWSLILSYITPCFIIANINIFIN